MGIDLQLTIYGQKTKSVAFWKNFKHFTWKCTHTKDRPAPLLNTSCHASTTLYLYSAPALHGTDLFALKFANLVQTYKILTIFVPIEWRQNADLGRLYWKKYCIVLYCIVLYYSCVSCHKKWVQYQYIENRHWDGFAVNSIKLMFFVCLFVYAYACLYTSPFILACQQMETKSVTWKR